jgi:ABC-type polysaccharide/polyol phosphate export permease
LADDMQKGIIDRFRSLPMSQAAVVFGRTASDVIYNVLSLMVMAGAGYLVGWRINNGVGSAMLGFGVLLLFAYALSWVMAYVGLVVPSPEVVNNAAFVPSDSLPTPLRVFAEWNPVSAVAQASRELFGNIPGGAAEPMMWSLQNPTAYTLIWALGVIAIFAPLAVRRFKRSRDRS